MDLPTRQSDGKVKTSSSQMTLACVKLTKI